MIYSTSTYSFLLFLLPISQLQVQLYYYNEYIQSIHSNNSIITCNTTKFDTVIHVHFYHYLMTCQRRRSLHCHSILLYIQTTTELVILPSLIINYEYFYSNSLLFLIHFKFYLCSSHITTNAKLVSLTSKTNRTITLTITSNG